MSPELELEVEYGRLAISSSFRTVTGSAFEKKNQSGVQSVNQSESGVEGYQDSEPDDR